MHAHPIPSDHEARCNATYEALMWALARPGLIRELPGQGMAQIVEALIDRECAVHCTDPGLAALAARTGAGVVGPAAADHVFADGLAEAALLRQLRCGSDLYPDAGATLICDARLGTGDALQLSGPGCDGAVAVRVGGLPGDFWGERARAIRYPMGFELFLVDGDRVLGVPRSALVEVR